MTLKQNNKNHDLFTNNKAIDYQVEICFVLKRKQYFIK